jgi:cyclic beta-1,2-glucan synthetase
MEALRSAIEEHAWDGEWYRRAYFGDGTPLGSAQNEECKIDSIVQSWAVLSGVAEAERARQAMRSALDRLVRWEDRLILLFTPPFDRSPPEPGYIKGYVPGIRENGGQYTHAAIWLVMAVARLGQGDQAHALFDLLNPIRHADKLDKAERYRVEPYVVAADVYSTEPHVGWGGWTWYTGSAGWLYQAGLEAILGVSRRGAQLVVRPCIPSGWDRVEIMYRYGRSVYQIMIENPEGVEQGEVTIEMDGRAVKGDAIDLRDDGQSHRVEVRLGMRRVSANGVSSSGRAGAYPER